MNDRELHTVIRVLNLGGCERWYEFIGLGVRRIVYVGDVENVINNVIRNRISDIYEI